MSSGNFKELKGYLEALLRSLPLSGPGSKLNQLLEFSLDDEWVASARVEGAFNREIEAALGARNNNGIFFIQERGRAIKEPEQTECSKLHQENVRRFKITYFNL